MDSDHKELKIIHLKPLKLKSHYLIILAFAVLLVVLRPQKASAAVTLGPSAVLSNPGVVEAFAAVMPAQAPVQVQTTAPAVAAKTKLPEQFGSGIKIRWGGIRKEGGWYPAGYCTAYVARKRGGVDIEGNANMWITSAKKHGYKTGKTPVKGAIMVTNEGGVGHVAWVEHVDPVKKTVTISEQNFVGFGKVSKRTVKMSYRKIVGYIY